jgi:hypothetical protein
MCEAERRVSQQIGQLRFDELLLGLEEGYKREERLRMGLMMGRFETGVIILLHPFIICMFISLQFGPFIHLKDPVLSKIKENCVYYSKTQTIMQPT